MAGQPNPKKIKFETEKKILDEVADEVACSICKIVPREIPLYMSPGGNIVCSKCKHANPRANFKQNELTRAMDKVLQSLPKTCKFRKDGCKIAANLNSIEYHEEDCEFRDILCPLLFCMDAFPFTDILFHSKTVHDLDLSMPALDEIVKQNRSKFTLKSQRILSKLKEFEENPTDDFMGHRYIGLVSGKRFLLHYKIDSFVFIQFFFQILLENQ